MVARIAEKERRKKGGQVEDGTNENASGPAPCTRSKIKQALRIKCNLLVRNKRIKKEKSGLWLIFNTDAKKCIYLFLYC